ncbi:MAG: replicative DNA helicase [Bacteroidales bacterium]|nr:replicative DNA helicase [Bacteroidales bacterium]
MENTRVATTSRKTENKLSYNNIENIIGNAGKIVPQAIEMEEAVLGALLIDANAVSIVIDFLTSNMFYREAHQKIYEAIYKLFSDSEPIDLLTVTNKLRQNKLLEFVGGASYLATLTNRVATSANIEYHARVVMEKFILRELITVCGKITKDAYDDSKDVLKIMDDAETDLFNIIQKNFKRDSKELRTVVQNAIHELQEMNNKSSDELQVRTGINAIDEKIGGWQRSDLVILAARPGMGKTSFVLSIARNAALKFDKKVAFFSLEMSATQLVHRLFAIESGISSEKISKGKLNESEWIRLMEKINVLFSSNLIIDDTPALSIFDLRAKCRRLKAHNDIDLVIVDYLQLMQGNEEGGKTKVSGNREQEISHISRSLKALAKDLNVPVIALSQLSRAVETRPGNKRPQLSDLRESGSIEQDADMVMFIYRPEYYKMESFEDNTPSEGLAEIMIEKNRHGSGGNIRVRFQSQFTKFTDVDDIPHFEDGGGVSAFDNVNAGIMPNSNFGANNAFDSNNDSNFSTFNASFNDDTNNDDDLPY